MMNLRLFLFALLLGGTSLLPAQDSLNMYKLFHWEDPSIPPAIFINNIYNEIWGWYDSTAQREYAIIGSSRGTHFFDVTDTGSEQFSDFVMGRGQQMIHRDYKNKGHYLYAVADEFESSLQIIDMSYLPDSVHVVYDEDSLFQTSHNIWIEGDRLYACIPRNWGAGTVKGGFGVYDISDPLNPTEIALYNQYGNIHDMYSRHDTVFLNAEGNGLYIVDLTDPLNPQTIAHMPSYPFQGYNHSGWATDDGQYYVFADETWGMPLKVVDLSDYSDPTLRSYLFPSLDFANRDTNAIAHNPVIRGNYVYTSYYYNGVYVFDISDPVFPTLVGFYDTFDGINDRNYKGAWGVYPLLPSGKVLVSDMQTGLYVLGLNGPYQTAVEPTAGLNLRLYPNPLQQKLTLESPQMLDDWTIVLLDELGRNVHTLSGKNPQQQWELSLDALSLRPGFYMLQLQSKQGSFHHKLIKQQ